MSTDLLARLQSRKFWAYLIAIITAIASLLTGDLTVPEFLKAVLFASASYQAAEGIVDAAARLRGS